MLQRVWSQEPRNTSVVFHGCCVMTCTGWCSTAGAVQALRDCSLVSSVPSSKVPHRQLGASLRSFRPPISPFGQPSQTEYPAVSSLHIWHLRDFSFAGLLILNSPLDSLRHVISPSSLKVLGELENASLCCQTLETWAHKRYHRFHGIALYKSTFNYLLTDTFTIHSNCSVVLLYYFSLNGVICCVTAWTFSSRSKYLGGHHCNADNF